MIKYHKQAEKFILSQNKVNATRIITAIEQLPLGDVKRLHGGNKPYKYRLRVGDYRVVFCVDQGVVIVLLVDNRGDVYKRM